MDTKTMIRELESVEEKHKHDKVFTGQINIATMAHDVRKRLEELKPYEDTGLTPEQIRELKEALSRENTQETARLSRDNDGWISVEEYGLPKEEGVYDVTIIDGRGVYDSVRWQFLEGTHLSGHQHYVDGIHYWADNYRGDPINKFLSNRVIAWKNKPDPYRPERSRNEKE